MKKLNVLVDWCDKNYSAFINEDVDGVIIVTDKTLDGLKTKLQEAAEFHFEGLGEYAEKRIYSGAGNRFGSSRRPF